MSHHAEGAGELIPCRFCGRSDLEIRTDPIVGFPAVNCLECGAVGPSSRSPEKREAAANWNRKAIGDARIQELEGERNIVSALIKKTLSMLHPSVELPPDLSMRDMVLQALALMRSSGVDSGWAEATAGHLAARGSVPCPCTARGEPPSCEWCGGLGWLTERVRWARWREMESSERIRAGGPPVLDSIGAGFGHARREGEPEGEYMERLKRALRGADRQLQDRVRATLACWSQEEREAARELLTPAAEVAQASPRSAPKAEPARTSNCDRCEPCGLPVDGVAGGCTRPYGHNYECQVEREPNGSPPITPPPSFKELLHDALSTSRSGGDPTISIEAAATKFMLACTRAEHQTAQASPPGAPPPSLRDRVHDACEEIERKLIGDASEERGQRIAAAGPIVIAFPFEGDIGPDPIPLHDRSWLLGIDRQIGTVKLVDGEAHCTFTDFEFGGAMHRLALASARSPALIVVVKRIDDRVVLVTKSAKSRIIDANQERSR